MADEMVKFSKNQILAQAGTAMLAQANQAGAGVLQLCANARPLESVNESIAPGGRSRSRGRWFRGEMNATAHASQVTRGGSVGTFSGLTSGIQWRDMVDQIMSIEFAAPDRSGGGAAIRAQSARCVVESISIRRREVPRRRRGVAKVVGGSTRSTRRRTSRRPRHATSSRRARETARRRFIRVEVLARRALRRSAGPCSRTVDAAGIAGSFALNGRGITVTALDTLATVRDKIIR